MPPARRRSGPASAPASAAGPTSPSLAEQHAATVAEACRLIETRGVAGLDALAARAGMSRFHFHRVFKAVTGVTPQGLRGRPPGERVRRGAAQGARVTAAIYDAGFNSNGRFYGSREQVLGMTPTELSRRRRQGRTIRFAVGECSLGSILVARSERGSVRDPRWATTRTRWRTSSRTASRGRADRRRQEFEEWWRRWWDSSRRPALGLDLPLDVRGTAFQQRVWQALREIPAGSTASYTEIAVGSARPGPCGRWRTPAARNALAVAIPCHRVVRNDGASSGYRWGVERKRELLEREAGR